jgi:type II secretory pathway pseudopilin PulG
MGSQKGNVVVIIVLVIILVILAGTGGYFYYRYTKSRDESNQLKSQVNSLQNQINANNKANNNTSNQTSSKCTKTGTMPTNGYIIADSNTRVIAASELKNLTPWQLKVARNEIYARHGRAFVHKDLACYFATQNWYKQNPNFSESQLSSTENKNIATILSYEKSISSPCTDTDSGC